MAAWKKGTCPHDTSPFPMQNSAYLRLLRYPAEQLLQEIPELGHRRDVATLIRRMRRTERRTETYQVHIGIYFPDKTALQTGMHDLYQRLFMAYLI